MSWSTPPVLFGLDWGSTHIRAFAFAESGEVIAQQDAALGVSHYAGLAGVTKMKEWLASWLQASPAIPVIACGMVGSASGWKVAPYVSTPAPTSALANGLLRWQEGGREWAIVPGVSHYSAQDGFTDVMRGEETQLVGLIASQPASHALDLILTPGTHNKWIRLDGEEIAYLATYMTGEMFALLKQHSLVGAVLVDSPWDESAFIDGVNTAAKHPDWLHQLFGVRARGVSKQAGGDALTHWLSGVLIGYEVHAALHAHRHNTIKTVGLLGSQSLCQRYQCALSALSIQSVCLDGDAFAARGLWEIALSAQLASHQPLIMNS